MTTTPLYQQPDRDSLCACPDTGHYCPHEARAQTLAAIRGGWATPGTYREPSARASSAPQRWLR